MRNIAECQAGIFQRSRIEPSENLEASPPRFIDTYERKGIPNMVRVLRRGGVIEHDVEHHELCTT